MSYRDRDRRRDSRDDYRGGDRYRGYGGGRDGGYGGGRNGGYGGGRDGGYRGGRDGGYGGGRDSFRGGRNDWDRRRDRDGDMRRFGGGIGGDDRRRGGGFGRGGGDRFGGRRGGGGRGGGGMRRDGKRMGGPNNGPPLKRSRSTGNWDEEDKHGFMQSIFMEDKPENFEEEWVFVVCPPGKRRLLVAANEITQSYNNAGAEDLKFQSCLPSGSEVKGELDKITDITILDTVYSGEKKMFYIVDMVHWKHYPYYETESEFRFYCLNDKWAQLKNPEEKTEANEYPLRLLEKHECTEEKITEAIKGFNTKIEGLLFIKKSALYKFKESLECQWLKLDKMEKVLGMPVPEGVSFAASNTKDEKRIQEQEVRKKNYEDRVAARSKQDTEESKEDEEKDGEEENEIEEQNEEEEEEKEPMEEDENY